MIYSHSVCGKGHTCFPSTASKVSVSNVTVTRVNDTAVMVTWMELTLNDARGFPSYVVSVTSEGKEVANHSTHSTSVVVGGLMPHTEYHITVRALTAGRTKEGPLSAPGETDAASLHICTDQCRQLLSIVLNNIALCCSPSQSKLTVIECSYLHNSNDIMHSTNVIVI